MSHPSSGERLRSIAWAFVHALTGIAFVAASAALVATQAPDGRQDLDAYRAAAGCPAAPARPADCLWTLEFTVSGIDLTVKRGESVSAILTDADGDRWRTRYPQSGPVLDRLDDGDRVTGTVWRGRVTEIAAGGDAQKTHGYPADMRARSLIGALIMAPSGLLLTAVSVWRLARRRTFPKLTPGMTAAFGLAYALFFVGLFSPLAFAGMEEEKAWPVLAVWVPIAALLTAGARYYVRQKRTSPGYGLLAGAPPRETPPSKETSAP
ncbi:hypothetical protein ACN3XK_45825 [Actinomadura welshii]